MQIRPAMNVSVHALALGNPTFTPGMRMSQHELGRDLLATAHVVCQPDAGVGYSSSDLPRPACNGVAVGDRPRGDAAKFLFRFKSPIGLSEEFPRNEDKVSVATGDYFVGVDSLGNEADCAGGYAGLLANGPCEGHLIALADGDPDRRYKRPGGHIDEIDSYVFELAAEHNGLLKVPSPIGPIGRGNANEDG